MGYLLLPVAFRSLSRLSSALSAKASTLRSSSLNQRIERFKLVQFRVHSVAHLSFVFVNYYFIVLSDDLGCLLLVYQEICFLYSVFKVQILTEIHRSSKTKNVFWLWSPMKLSLHGIASLKLTYILNLDNFQNIRQPPALPYRLQHSTIGRLSLNHRVRDENGCVP